MWRYVFIRIGLVGLLILAVVSCEAVNDILGVEDDDDSSGSELGTPVGIETTDWSQSRYDEIARVTGDQSVSVPSSYAGQQLLYVATNSGSREAMVSVPFASVQSSSNSSSILGNDATFADEVPQAIAGFPGQFDELFPIDRPSSSVVGPSSVTAASTFRFATNTRNVQASLATQRSDGTWSLNIWLDDDDNDTGVVTMEMLNAVADRFLIPGADNDIFDWVTPVFGDPWGPRQDPDLIGEDRRDIHILFYDIDNDGPPTEGQGRVVGYFWSKDNYPNGTVLRRSDGTTTVSNGRLMFYMDSALLSNGEDGVWELTDPWPQTILSVLAHEFQHMIQFYQRDVVVGSAAEYGVWLNELASEVAEDLVSRRLGTEGPRGVDASDGTAGPSDNSSGRMPRYNATGNQTPLVGWTGSLDDYSVSYAFGAFLLRTFGAELFHLLLTETPAGSEIVGYSVSSLERNASRLAGRTISMEELLRRWGVAVAVSNDTGVPRGFRLNHGGWIATSGGGMNYSVGSLNAHNYDEGRFWYRADQGAVDVAATANAFVLGGFVPQDGVTLDFSLPTDVEVTVLTWRRD